MAVNHEIVQVKETVTLVGGGSARIDDLLQALKLAPFLVAADGGASLAHQAGVMPEAVIGDFDSIPAHVLNALPADRLHKIPEQDSTDFEKALRNIRAPLIFAVGFTGGRVDHQLAALHGLVRYPDRPCILIGETEIICVAPPDISLDLDAGDTVSLFPLGDVTGTSQGLQWPIQGLDFAPDRKIGTSNSATGRVRLWFESPNMLLILPRRVVQQVARGLITAPARWPAL